MNRGREAEEAAIKYLKIVSATDVHIEQNGGKHRKLYYTYRGHKLFHVLPNIGGTGASDGDATHLLIADLKREVRKYQDGDEGPDKRIVKISMVRTGGTRFALRIAISRAAYSALNPDGNEYIQIGWDTDDRVLILTPVTMGGFKPQYLSNAGKKNESFAWILQTSKTPDWIVQCKVISSLIFERKIGGKFIRIPIPTHFIKQDHIPVESHLRKPPEPAVPTLSDGTTALAMLNEWLATQQKEGKDFTSDMHTKSDGVKVIRITMSEEL